MTSRDRLCKALQSPNNLRFGEMTALVGAFGYRLSRVSGGHHIYVHPGCPAIVNLQNVKGKAKPSGSSVPPDRRTLQSETGRGVKDYHINIFYSDEDGGYVADVPDLEACSAFGKTPDEALAEVQRAKKAWLAAAGRHRRPVPEPRYRPAIYQAAR